MNDARSAGTVNRTSARLARARARRARSRSAAAPAAPPTRPGRAGRAARPRRRRGRPRCARGGARSVSPSTPISASSPSNDVPVERGVAEPVPERERRGRVDVRHVGAPARAAPRGSVVGCVPAVAGTLTGRRPLGFTRPLSTPAIARGALLAREERLHDRGRLGRRRGRARTAGRRAARARWACPSSSTASRSCLLRAGQRERLGVAALAARAAAEQAGAVAEREDHDVGGCRERRGIRRCRRSRRRRRSVPRAKRISRRRELRAQRLEQGRDADAQLDARVLRHDVRRERVAAEHGVRVVGVRADDRDASPARRAAARRRCAAARPPRSASSRGERPVRRRSRGRPCRGAPRRRRGRHRASAGGTGDQSASSSPSSAFWRSTRRSARVDERHVDGARFDRASQRLAERLHRRQLDVDARVERGAGRLAPRCRRRRAGASGTRRRSSRRRPCRRSPTSRAAAR